MDGEFGVVELLLGLETAVSRARVSFDTKVFLCLTRRQILVWRARCRTSSVRWSEMVAAV